MTQRLDPPWSSLVRRFRVCRPPMARRRRNSAGGRQAVHLRLKRISLARIGKTNSRKSAREVRGFCRAPGRTRRAWCPDLDVATGHLDRGGRGRQDLPGGAGCRGTCVPFPRWRVAGRHRRAQRRGATGRAGGAHVGYSGSGCKTADRGAHRRPRRTRCAGDLRWLRIRHRPRRPAH